MLRDFGIVALMYAFQPQFFGLGIAGKVSLILHP